VKVAMMYSGIVILKKPIAVI